MNTFCTRAFALLAVFGLSACAELQPYIESTDTVIVSPHGYEVEIPKRVLVCYNSESTQPKNVSDLAVKECAKTGRKVKFLRQDFLACPVLLPARAHFACVGEPQIAKGDPRYSKLRVTKDRVTEQPQPVDDKEGLPPELPSYLKN